MLVVDDEEAIRIISRRILEAFGYRALVAADGHEGIRLYGEASAEIAVVITDMGMPGIDGHETIRALIGINPKVRIIAMSGFAVEEQPGGDRLPPQVCGLLEKPYNTETFLRAVHIALAGPHGA